MKIDEIRAKFPQYADVPDGELVRGLHRKFYADMPYQDFLKGIDFAKPVNPTEGMGGMQKFNAGVGKAMTDVGQGAAQMVGMGPSAQEVQDRRALDKPLMATGAGMAGNVSGNIAMLAPLAVAPGGATVAGAGALGALAGALQPTEGGQERLGNMAMGGALGAGVQTVARYPAEIWDAAKGLGRGLKATVEPFYEGGREAILSRALRNASGGNPDVSARLAGARELVPGSVPTAAEVAGSPGIAALQRTASATNPEAYATRAAQQNEARIRDLTELAGTQGRREFFAADRATAADSLYSKAYEKGVDIRRNPETGHFLSKAEISGVKGEITKLTSRPAIQDAMESARKLAANEGVRLTDPTGSVKGLDYLKRALDDKISTATGNEQRVLVDLKNRLLTTIDRLSPDYAAARTTFRDMSKPINQMDISQTIADKSINKLTDALKPQSFANALTDDTAAAATNFRKATLENTLEPAQLARLNAIKDDLARSVQARDLGRGPGSDTFQKLSMSNLMQRSGLPDTAMRVPMLGRVANWAYENADNRMRQQLAEALLNPREAGRLLNAAPPMGLPPNTNPAIGERAAMLARMLMLPAIPQLTRPE